MFDFIHAVFYVFAIIAVLSAIVVITTSNPVRSVLALVVTFFAMAGVWMLLQAEFLALILLLVYVGAVMTLFLFVVMMLNITREARHSGFVRYFPLGMILVIVLFLLMLVGIGPHYFGLTEMPPPPLAAESYSNTRALGALLYTDYVYPFEVAGVLLLAAMIAAITLTHRGPVHRRVQTAHEQIDIDVKERIRLIDMPSESNPNGANT